MVIARILKLVVPSVVEAEVVSIFYATQEILPLQTIADKLK